MKVVVTSDQLRRAVPGGIGVYIQSLMHGISLASSPDMKVNLWSGPSVFPASLLVRAWSAGLFPAPQSADVVHASSAALPPTRGLPLTVTVHDVAWREYPEAFSRRGRLWHEAALGKAIKRADKLITPSLQTASALLQAGAGQDRIAVIPLGADHLPPSDDEAAKARLMNAGVNAGVNSEFLLTVSTLEPRKNLPRLMEAYSKIRGLLPEPWPLVVVGPAGWGEEIKPCEGVILLGPIPAPELSSLYKQCRTFAYVPFLEGFGLPVIEAMSMGAPIVASSVPSAGDATVEVDPLKVDDIASALLKVSTDEQLRSELMARGTNHAATHTWKNCAQAHIGIWKSL